MKEERKLIIDLAEKALFMGMFDSHCRHRKPGEFIERLPEEQRKTLETLTSEDMDGIMPPWLRWSPPESGRK